MKRIAIYARVSTDRQKVESQLLALSNFAERSGWELAKQYIDEGFTGKNTARPAFNEMLEAARKREFDVLLVWSLDRLSRSLRDLVTTLDELSHYGVDFISFNDRGIDTTTPSGKLMFHIIAAISQFERELIRERVIAGVKNAQAKGKHCGRPGIAPYIIEEATELRQQGWTYEKIGKKFGVSADAIRKKLPKSLTGKIPSSKDIYCKTNDTPKGVS